MKTRTIYLISEVLRNGKPLAAKRIIKANNFCKLRGLSPTRIQTKQILVSQDNKYSFL